MALNYTRCPCVEGLAARHRDGYAPLFAVLALSPLSDWVIADAIGLQHGVIVVDSLRPRRQQILEQLVHGVFDKVVEDHIEGALAKSQFYLDATLRELGIHVLEVAPVGLGNGRSREFKQS